MCCQKQICAIRGGISIVVESELVWRGRQICVVGVGYVPQKANLFVVKDEYMPWKMNICDLEADMP